MRVLHEGANWVRQLFRSRKFEREMQAEMAAHIEQEAALYQARGLSASEAMAAARRDFGNVPFLQEQSHDARGTRWFEDTKRDLRYGIRGLLRTPGFTLAAILSLTLGLGVNTAMFTFGRFLFAPQQLSEPETYVTYRSWLTYPGWQAIAKERNLFEKTVVHAVMDVALSGDGTNSVKATADLVSDGYFSMYSGHAHLGRVLVPGESSNASAPAAAVLSYPFWRRQLSSDSNIVGRTLRLTNGLQLTIVGVANQGFKGAMTNARSADFWIPLAVRDRMPTYQRGDQRSVSPFADANTQWLSLSAQLPEGVPLEQTLLHLKNLVTHLPTADSTGVSERSPPLLTAGTRAMINKNNAGGVSLALSATIMVLLIGCANVANLVLARGVRRRREIAVRLSLGASRARLIRQLMTESAILAVVGGISALIVSRVIMRILSGSELLLPLEIDSETLANGLKSDSFVVIFTFVIFTFVIFTFVIFTFVIFTFVMAFVSAAASGLLPALRSTKVDLSRATRDDGAAIGTRLSRSRLRSGLVVGQVALSLLLLITTTVLLRSSATANESDVGFDRSNIVTTSASRSENGYTNTQYAEFGRVLQDRSMQIVGAENVARGTIPLAGEMDYPRVNPAETPRRSTALAVASHNYFAVLGIPIVRGRAFTELEARNKAPIVIVSEATVKRDVIHNQGKVRGAEVTSTYTGILGAFGLLLSAIGIFGVAAYAVSQRTREIGVRLAIGAQPSDVLRLMLVQGMRPVLFGVVLGVATAAFVTRALRVFLFGITPTDPIAYLAAVGVVSIVALLACYLPSRRATTIDPVGALRAD